MMNLSKKFLAVGATCLLFSTPVIAAESSHDFANLVDSGKFFGEVRYRYEGVEQDGIAKNARAHTVRTNLGFKTGVYRDFQALVETQIVHSVGGEQFNSTTNGNTNFPVVADPNVTELNELWVAWSGLPQSTVKVGRQKINLDNQRFIGTVDWRQNDQTFDGIQITNNSIEDLSILYSYIGNVNRIQGDDHPLGDLDSAVHIANVSYQYSEWLKLTAYGYWLDFDESAANSSRTYGVRATGKVPINEDWAFIYEAEAATQRDHANNTTNYDEEYYHIVPGITGHGFTVKAGYEVLGGDGTGSFRTPLATAHKFSGWADLFLTTPAAGLEDAYFSVSYKVSGTNSIADGVKLGGIYHEYDSDSTIVGDFGDELNLFVSKSFTLPDNDQLFKKVNVLVKYADYDGETAAGVSADTKRLWFQVGVPF